MSTIKGTTNGSMAVLGFIERDDKKKMHSFMQVL